MSLNLYGLILLWTPLSQKKQLFGIFLIFLKERELISDVIQKIRSEQLIEPSTMSFDSSGPIPGVDLQTLLREGAMGEVFGARCLFAA